MPQEISLGEHPEFRRRFDKWRELMDLYEGDPKTLRSPLYLWPYAIELKGKPETDQLRLDRERRSKYLNFSEILVSLWGSLFFREAIDYSGVKSLFSELERNNIDGMKTPLDTFIKERLFVARINEGKVACVVDSLGEPTATKADEQRSVSRVTWNMVPAVALPDWSFEQDDVNRVGEFNSVRYEYDLIKPRQSVTEPAQQVTRSRVYNVDGNAVICEIYELKGKDKKDDNKNKWVLIETIPLSNLDIIPVIISNDESWIYDAAQESLRFYNLRSVKDTIQHAQGYDARFITGVSPGSEHAKQMGENVVNFLPEGATLQQFAPVELGSYEKALAQSVDYIFKVGLNQLRSLPADSRESMAADAQQAEKENTKQLVKTAIEGLNNFLADCVSVTAKFKGAKEGGQITISDAIEDEDIDSWLRITAAFKDVIKQVPEWDKANAKKALRKCGLPTGDYELAAKALDDATLQNPDRLQREFNNRAIDELVSGQTQDSADNSGNVSGR